VAYGTDFLPEQIQQLAAEHDNFEAVKESSTDARRVSAIRALLDRRLEISVGVDDAVLEAVGVGATGWIAGLANALPRESVDLFNLGVSGESDKAFELYRWFLPLLRMDTVPNFVQLIKLVQVEVGIGNALVRPPDWNWWGMNVSKPYRSSVTRCVPGRSRWAHMRCRVGSEKC
jgi:4-hydroxy-tetrahydrodipicolinate synthase